MNYTSTGFTAVSLNFQAAPDADGQPGAAVTWPTLATNVTLPLTSTTTGSVTAIKFQPWARINAATLTGTGRIIVTARGWRARTGADDPGRFSATTGAALIQVGNVAVADDLSNGNFVFFPVTNGSASPTFLGVGPMYWDGSNWDRAVHCTNSVSISVAAATTTQLVAISGTTRIRVCAFTLVSAGVNTAKFVRGTGAACATGTADLTGAMTFATASNVPMSSGAGWLFQGNAGDALCLTTTAAVQMSGFLSYAQY